MRVMLLVMMALLFARPALACRYQARPFDENVKAATTAFVGTVTTVENRQATLVVEKAFRGIKDGETISVEISESSCAIRFEPGQRWVYLGDSLPSGSMLLMDDYGRIIPENIAAAKKALGDFPEDGSGVRHGEITGSCAPWDGAAAAITLDNGVTATVYAGLSEIGKKDQNSIAAYQADGKPERGHAAIVQCPNPKDGQAENLPCQSAQGTVYMGIVTDSEASGYIEIKDGAENHSRHVFRVKRVNKQVFCG